MGDLRGGDLRIFYTKKGGGGTWKFFQNTEVRRGKISKAVFYKVVRQFNH